MIALIIGMLVSLIVTLVGTPLLIRLVHKLHYGQYIRQDGPQSHLVKRGTPRWAAWSSTSRFCSVGHPPHCTDTCVRATCPPGPRRSYCSPCCRWVCWALSTTSPRCVRSRTKAYRWRQVHWPVHLRHHLRGTCAADSHQIGIPQCAGRHQLHRTAVLQLRLRRPCRSHHPVRHLGELPDDRMDQRSESDGWT